MPVIARIIVVLFTLIAVNVSVANEPDHDTLAQSIDELASEMLTSHGAVGLSIAVARNGEIIHAEAYGLAEVEHGVEANADTLFRIGSVTKQFTAAAVMKLVEQGKLSLDDELATFFPDFPMHGHIVTIRHLLTHTSGIKSYTGVPEFWQTSVSRDLTVKEMLAIVDEFPYDFAPDEQYMYNNTAYYMLGPIIEQASGVPYCEFLQTEFFEPLGLKNMRCDSNSAVIPNRAQGYEIADGEIVNDGLIGMNNPGAAGMLVSTARDLVSWKTALMNGEVVNEDSLRQMITPHTLTDGSSTDYGFGLSLGEYEGHPRISHGGGIFGFNSMLSYFPADDVSIAVIVSGGASSGLIAQRIASQVLNIEVEVADIEPTLEEIERFSGTYEQGRGDREAVVFARDGSLYVQAPGQPEFKILHQGEGEFRASFDNAIKIVFDITPEEGPSPAFTLHQGGRQMRATRKAGD